MWVVACARGSWSHASCTAVGWRRQQGVVRCQSMSGCAWSRRVGAGRQAGVSPTLTAVRHMSGAMWPDHHQACPGRPPAPLELIVPLGPLLGLAQLGLLCDLALLSSALLLATLRGLALLGATLGLLLLPPVAGPGAGCQSAAHMHARDLLQRRAGPRLCSCWARCCRWPIQQLPTDATTIQWPAQASSPAPTASLATLQQQRHPQHPLTWRPRPSWPPSPSQTPPGTCSPAPS